MNPSLLIGRLAAALAPSMLAACAPQEPEDLRNDPIYGTMQGVAWHSGPASVRHEPARGVVVRIYEQGTPGEPCAVPLTHGRRIEVTLPYVALGRFEAASNAGFRVEAWNGEVG